MRRFAAVGPGGLRQTPIVFTRHRSDFCCPLRLRPHRCNVFIFPHMNRRARIAIFKRDNWNLIVPLFRLIRREWIIERCKMRTSISTYERFFFLFTEITDRPMTALEQIIFLNLSLVIIVFLSFRFMIYVKITLTHRCYTIVSIFVTA